MKLIDGLWWPDFDVQCRAVVIDECAAAMPLVLPLVAEKRVCVQAGGNVGVYPLALSKVFGEVITFEPDEDNFECLHKNVTYDDALVFFGALGAEPGWCAVIRTRPASPFSGSIPPPADRPTPTASHAESRGSGS